MIANLSIVEKFTRIFSIPYSGLLSVIFGIMLLSFPIGAYLVFNSDFGKEINYQYPIKGLGLFFGGISYKLPISFEVGDAFVLAWTTFVVLFSISYLGPDSSLLKTLSDLMSKGWKNLQNNALGSMITWFSILVLASAVIETIQQNFGIKIESPQIQNDLIHFFQLTIAPLTEETGFRVILIGIPLFLIYSHSSSWKLFFKSLWRPSAYLHITNYRKAMVLIITIGLFFGAAHIISGTPWSTGKFSQATVAGIIIGWVYVRYGFAPAVLIHWATNYFLFSYLFFISSISQTTINESNPFSSTLEAIIVTTGVISLIIKILNYIDSRKKPAIEKSS